MESRIDGGENLVNEIISHLKNNEVRIENVMLAG